jgi:hypothetical protein
VVWFLRKDDAPRKEYTKHYLSVTTMRLRILSLTLLLYICVVRAQWGPGDPDDPDDNDPGWPNDPPDGPPDDDPPPWQPTPTGDPSSSSASTPSPTDDPDDPPVPIFTGVDTFDNATLYQPDDATHHLTSPRTENLPNNTVLAVWNDSSQTSGTLQIWQTTNNGFSWYAHGTVTSNSAGRLLLEPHLMFVPSLGDDTNITLLAINAVDATSTNIELYASTDFGATFDFVNLVAEGGAVGSKAVGEPHLLVQYVISVKFTIDAAKDEAVTIALPCTIQISVIANMHRRSLNSPRPTFIIAGALLSTWLLLLPIRIEQEWQALRR